MQFPTLFTVAILLLSQSLGEAAVGDATDAATTKVFRKLPELFDFERYKEVFKKSYATQLEEQVRHNIFLARAFQVFVSMVNYNEAITSHYLSLNPMSDWTERDINQSKVTVATMRSMNSLNSASKFIEPPASPTVGVTREQLERKLAEIEQRRDEPAFAGLAEELEQSSGRSGRARTDKRHLTEEQVMGQQALGSLLARRVQVESNNAQYQVPELTSFGLVETQDGASENFESLLREEGAGKEFLDSLVRGSGGSKPAKEVEEESPQVPDLENSPHADTDSISLPEVDHRRSGCFLQPRHQGPCGSCYAFSMMALYEYNYCRQTKGQRVAFSEQFMVDCGARSNLFECRGGNIVMAALFVEQIGLELRTNYPYRAKADKCPYGRDADAAHMGYLKIPQPSAGLVNLTLIHEQIQRMPVVVGVKVNSHFRQYGGGVDTATDCGTDDEAHAMLMVGSGRENGREYFLLRNSHSVAWGEAGHYKLAKESFYACSVYPFGVTLAGPIEGWANVDNDQMRQDYRPEPIQQRYADYM